MSLRPDEETRTVMESSGETTWREDTGEEVKKNILRVIKEEWKSVKPSVPRHHQRIRDK